VFVVVSVGGYFGFRSYIYGDDAPPVPVLDELGEPGRAGRRDHERLRDDGDVLEASLAGVLEPDVPRGGAPGVAVGADRLEAELVAGLLPQVVAAVEDAQVRAVGPRGEELGPGREDHRADDEQAHRTGGPHAHTTSAHRSPLSTGVTRCDVQPGKATTLPRSRGIFMRPCQHRSSRSPPA